MKKKIIIVVGDPNSINSEIFYKCYRQLNPSIKEAIYLVANYELIVRQFKRLKKPLRFIKVNNIFEEIKGNRIKILNVNLKFEDPFNVKTKEASNYVINSLNYAHKLAFENKVNGFINCAIDKKLLKKNKIGVTEYLASKCKVKKNSEVMLIRNNMLAVSPITTHSDLKEVSKKIREELIINKTKTISSFYKKIFRKNAKFGILGLNPHNAELRKNSEEKKVIIPAIKKLKKKGINVKGPIASDTIFIKDYKNFDVIIGMYHDQVIAPYKTLYGFDAINITLGLKYLRISPDHGTAINLIGKNKADGKSLLECIKFMHKYNQ